MQQYEFIVHILVIKSIGFPHNLTENTALVSFNGYYFPDLG